MMGLWLWLQTSMALAQPLIGEVGDDGIPEALRAVPDLPEITASSEFDPYAPLQVVGGVITTIEFSGLDHIDEFVLRSSLLLSEGDVVDPLKVRKSIQVIHSTGYFEDVRVEGFRQSTAAESNGVRLVFTIKENPSFVLFR